MTNEKSYPFSPRGSAGEIETALALQPKFDADGLIAALVTDAKSGEVLMFAWMNAEALAATLETRLAHFWSRSRGRLWKKGEESGNLLHVEEIRVDCDQDALWLRVTVGGAGAACHTGERSCFYRTIELGPARIRARGAAPQYAFVSSARTNRRAPAFIGRLTSGADWDCRARLARLRLRRISGSSRPLIRFC